MKRIPWEIVKNEDFFPHTTPSLNPEFRTFGIEAENLFNDREFWESYQSWDYSEAKALG